jgi:Lipocalin-like domain
MSEGNGALVGTWRLVSAIMRDVETNEEIPIWGDEPNGCLVLTPANRWIVIQTAQGRKAPHTEEERAGAFNSMLAYAGKFRTKGNQIVIAVDIAWDEGWNGTEQVRSYRVEGDCLHIEAAPQRYRLFGEKHMRGILIWKRD